MSSEKKRIWITGASSGIGRACALLWAERGCRLVLTSSNAAKLEEVGQACRERADLVLTLPYDLSDPSGIERLCQEAWEAFGGLDLVFLNAGISQRTSVEDTSGEMMRKIMEIDFFSCTAIAKALLPRFLSQDGGHFAVTSSITGYFGFPLRCAYSSAKHALYGFFESLEAEYYNKGIAVTMVCPGRVRTDISLRSLDKGGAPHGKMDPGQEGGISPDKAAEKIAKAVSARKREVLVGGKELIMVYIKRFLPSVCARLSRKIKAM